MRRQLTNKTKCFGWALAEPSPVGDREVAKMRETPPACDVCNPLRRSCSKQLLANALQSLLTQKLARWIAAELLECLGKATQVYTDRARDFRHRRNIRGMLAHIHFRLAHDTRSNRIRRISKVQTRPFCPFVEQMNTDSADRLRKAGKPHKVIITAVARKLVTIANALRQEPSEMGARGALKDLRLLLRVRRD